MLFSSLTLAAGVAAAITCPPDAVPVGSLCVDKYEASVWSVPNPTTSNRKLVGKLEKGTATLRDLVAGGATQLGCDFPPFDHDLFPASFPTNGNWSKLIPPTPGVYAASVSGVTPSACISWFQAQQACALAEKRLPTNAEWQAAAAGTPDPGNADDGSTTCVTNTVPAHAGSRVLCRSNWGASDMIGNVAEWVADWTPVSTNCPGWDFFSDDKMCLAGANEFLSPAALIRGGSWLHGSDAGIFSVDALHQLVGANNFLGLRCARSPSGSSDGD